MFQHQGHGVLTPRWRRPALNLAAPLPPVAAVRPCGNAPGTCVGTGRGVNEKVLETSFFNFLVDIILYERQGREGAGDRPPPRVLVNALHKDAN
jgi:hypothetical protein